MDIADSSDEPWLTYDDEPGDALVAGIVAEFDRDFLAGTIPVTSTWRPARVRVDRDKVQHPRGV